MKNNIYTVVLKVADRNSLADIIDAVEGKAASIEVSTVTPDNGVAAAPRSRVTLAPQRTPVRKERKLRGSKVNEAILSAINVGGGTATNAAMKAALEAIGKSASSLQTGIRALTQSGQIERVGEGLYGLKTAKAAE